MKRFRIYLTSASYLVALLMPFATFGTVHAATNQPGMLQCSGQQEAVIGVDQVLKCDLSLDKQVSVNGGAFADADTSDAAVSAQVGDTVTWKITIRDTSTKGLNPHGVIYTKDILPVGVSFVSYVASDGTYTGNDGSFFANHWYLPLLKNDGEFQVTTLPATLTITTKATGTGLIQNTAAIDKYDTGSCDGGCVYSDSDPSSDTNDAWINIPQVPPQVLGESTTVSPDTGYGIPAKSNAVADLLITTGLLSLIALGFSLRKKNSTRE